MVIGSLVWRIVRLRCRLVVVVWCLCRVRVCRWLVSRMGIRRVWVRRMCMCLMLGLNRLFCVSCSASGEAGWRVWVFAD